MKYKILFGFFKNCIKGFCKIVFETLFEYLLTNFFDHVRNGILSEFRGRWRGQIPSCERHSCPIALHILFSTRNRMWGASKVTFRNGVALNYFFSAQQENNHIDFTYHTIGNRPSFSMDLDYCTTTKSLTGVVTKNSTSGMASSYPISFEKYTIN